MTLDKLCVTLLLLIIYVAETVSKKDDVKNLSIGPKYIIIGANELDRKNEDGFYLFQKIENTNRSEARDDEMNDKKLLDDVLLLKKDQFTRGKILKVVGKTKNEFRRKVETDLISKSILPESQKRQYGIRNDKTSQGNLTLYKFKITEKPLKGIFRKNFGKSYQESLEDSLNILGVPDKDYPIYDKVPNTGFSCFEKTGLFADEATRCQVFHICHYKTEVTTSHLCPNGTVFNKDHLVCDWWYNVDCTESKPRSKSFWYLGLSEHQPTYSSKSASKTQDHKMKQTNSTEESQSKFLHPLRLPPTRHLSAHGALPPSILRAIRQRNKYLRSRN